MLRMSALFTVVLIGLSSLAGCVPDDVKETGSTGTTGSTEEADADTDADTDTDSDTDTDADADAIVGEWLCEGGDLPPFFVENNITRVTANFASDGTYAVTTVYNGTPYNVTGTYSVDVSTAPHTVVVQQDSPVITSEGIWEVTGSTMRYEIVQTSPDQGFVPPTPETGFGSSQGGGVAEGDLIQTYQKQ